MNKSSKWKKPMKKPSNGLHSIKRPNLKLWDMNLVSYIEEIIKILKQFGKKLKIQLDKNLTYRKCNKSN